MHIMPLSLYIFLSLSFPLCSSFTRFLSLFFLSLLPPLDLSLALSCTVLFPLVLTFLLSPLSFYILSSPPYPSLPLLPSLFLSPLSPPLFSQPSPLQSPLQIKEPFYIRCIKPNNEKMAQQWDDKLCRHQVAYLGLLENLRVRRAGYCNRQPYEAFLDRYKVKGSESARPSR